MIDPERQEKCMKRHNRKKAKYMMAGCVAVLLLSFVGSVCLYADVSGE